MSGVPSQRGRVGTLINGKWVVEARIGSGGMSTVYSATHKNNGSRAALKILHPDLAREEEVKSRFLREGYVANQVRHPGIVEVIDDDVSEAGDVYLVVELLEGTTLEALRMQSHGRLPLEQVLTVSLEALDALSAAHLAGIVHRDLKPDNLFLTTQNKVKILDFGLARLLEGIPGAETTRAGVMIGTPEFMSPEQATAKRDQIDAQSDVWGMGATMYTLLTGKHVHEAGSIREHLIAAATRQAEPVRKLAPWVPEPIAHVVDRALAFERAQRWPDARAMYDALVAARGGVRPRTLSKPDTGPISKRAPEPEHHDDADTVMTQMTKELYDRISEGDVGKDRENVEDTVVVASDAHISAADDLSMPPLGVAHTPPAPPPQPPPPPRPRMASRPDLEGGPLSRPRMPSHPEFPPPSQRAPMSQHDYAQPPMSQREYAQPPMSQRDYAPPPMSQRDYAPPPSQRDYAPPPSQRDYGPPPSMPHPSPMQLGTMPMVPAPLDSQAGAQRTSHSAQHDLAKPKRVSWAVLAIVAFISLLLAAGVTITARAYLKRR